MTRLLATAFAALLIAPGFCLAAEVVPAKHSTVHVVFISPHSQQMFGMRLDDTTPMARVGDMIVAANSVRPIGITIDGDFVGHAMVGNLDVKPVFVLPEGVRKFTFTLDGTDPVAMDITVLGTGSKQYLIVKLPPNPQPAESGVTDIDDSTDQPLDQ